MSGSEEYVGTTSVAAIAEAEAEWEDDEYALPPVNDPFERVNRSIFKFNDAVYTGVFRPVARGYETVVPRPVRRGLVNFFDNIRYPVRLVGCLMQGKAGRAASETGRFVVDTTAGLGGFIKVSDDVPGLRVPQEDLGQALGKWGVPNGPFVVLPIFGPSTFRDVGGMAGDYVLTPTNWRFIDNYSWEVRNGIIVVNAVSNMPDIVNAYEAFQKASLDPYVAFRNGYLQYREASVKD